MECFERWVQCSAMLVLVPKGAFDSVQTRKEASVLWPLAFVRAGRPPEENGSSAGKGAPFF